MTTAIDAHVHVWDPARFRYPWLDGTVLDRPRMPADLPGCPLVDAAVFVQADCLPEQGAAEAAWVAGLDWPGLAGIVAFAPVDRGARVREHLDALRGTASVVGVRRLLQDEPDDLVLGPAVRAGLREVAAAGFAFDLCVRWQQLPASAAAVRAVPGLRVVLDHLGKPPVRDGIGSEAGERWRTALRELLRNEGVVVKLSGLGAEADPAAPFAPAATPFVETALDLAGPERCLVGSDWPVSFVDGPDRAYGDWFDLVRTAAGSEEAWTAVARRTAARVYGLGGQGSER